MYLNKIVYVDSKEFCVFRRDDGVEEEFSSDEVGVGSVCDTGV